MLTSQLDVEGQGIGILPMFGIMLPAMLPTLQPHHWYRCDVVIYN